MENNPSPKGPSDAELAASIENCIQLMEDGIALLEAVASRFKAQQALADASRIADEGNCYFAAAGTEHGRALRGKPD